MSLKSKWINFLYRVATGNKKLKTLLTPIGTIIYASFTALFVVLALQVDKMLNFSRFVAEPFNIILSLPVILLGLFITGWSGFHFREAKGTPVPINPPPELVTSGPFAYVRNPMVTGIFIILFGLSVLFGSLTLLFVFTPLYISINMWELKAIEEPELEKRLGEKYIQYKQRTPMFIPSLKRNSK